LSPGVHCRWTPGLPLVLQGVQQAGCGGVAIPGVEPGRGSCDLLTLVGTMIINGSCAVAC
jgi:hypothetical protein